jgi:hypothetical protein
MSTNTSNHPALKAFLTALALVVASAIYASALYAGMKYAPLILLIAAGLGIFTGLVMLIYEIQRDEKTPYDPIPALIVVWSSMPLLAAGLLAAWILPS